MNGSRLRWLAGVAFAVTMTACGSASTAPSPTATRAAGTTQPPSQTPVALTAQIVFSGGATGMLSVDPAQSQCSLLPSGGFTAQLDGVLPGTTAALTIDAATGTNPVAPGSDTVNFDTSADDWAFAVSGTTMITITGKTSTGSVNAVIAGSPQSGAVANLQISGSFTCVVSNSSG